MDTIESLKGTVTLWKDDYKMLRYEVNMLGDVPGIIGEFLLKDFNYYTKATLEWNGQTYTVQKPA
jgi:hypothetical protein